MGLRMSEDNRLKKRYKDAVKELYYRGNYLAAELTKLGYPKSDERIPTAGVAWDDKRKKIIFLFNPDFASKLNDEQFLFVACHEAIHILNGHVFLMKSENDRLIRTNRSQEELMRFRYKFNIAADCVVNDSLTSLYSLVRQNFLGYTEFTLTEDCSIVEAAQKMVANPLTPDDIVDIQEANPSISDVNSQMKAGTKAVIPGFIIYGDKTVGTNCADLTVMDVYLILPDDRSQSALDPDNHMWDTFFDSSGDIKKEFVDKMGRFLDKNMENSTLSDGEAGKIDELRKNMKNSNDSYVSAAGQNASGTRRPIDNLGNESINWNKILFRLTDTIKAEEKWNRPNRRLMSIYPDVILPSYPDQEEEHIFVAIDSSGSIDYKALSLFVSVLKNTPRNFKIKAISFDNKCYEYDVRGTEMPQGGGGTDFGIIEDYIQKNFKKYPAATFILTDGCGTSVHPQYENRWAWILYGSSSEAYCKNMARYKIEELLK